MRKVRVEPRYLKQRQEPRFTTVDPQPRYVGVGVSRRGPSARIGTTLVGAPASSTVVGRAGTVFARRSATIIGVTAEAFTEALDGFPASYPHIPGVAAQSTSGAFAGSVSTNWNVNVAGQESIAVATSGVGVVSAAGNIHIVGQPIASPAVAGAGEVTTIQNVDAVGPVSTSIGLAPQGSVSTGTTITGVTAEAVCEALAGVMEDAVHADVRGDAIVSGAGGFAGQVSTHPIIAGVTAEAASTAVPGTVVAGVSTSVSGFVADSTGTGQSGVVQAVRHVNVAGVAAVSTTSGQVGSVSAQINFARQRMVKNGDTTMTSSVSIIPNWLSHSTSPATISTHRLVVQGSKADATVTFSGNTSASVNGETLRLFRNGVQVASSLMSAGTGSPVTVSWSGSVVDGDLFDLRGSSVYNSRVLSGSYLEVV